MRNALSSFLEEKFLRKYQAKYQALHELKMVRCAYSAAIDIFPASSPGLLMDLDGVPAHIPSRPRSIQVLLNSLLQISAYAGMTVHHYGKLGMFQAPI